MTTNSNDSMMMRALGVALNVDPASAKGDVRALRAKYPSLSREELARKLISRARWQGAALGVATGLPSNPWVAVPAAMADVGGLLRIQVAMAARVALLFDERYLDGNDPPYELMAPIMGGRLMSEMGRELAIRGGMGVTRQAIKKVLSKGTLKQFKRLMLKYFGLKVTQRSLITKTLPLVGGAIGGTWNFIEVKVVGERAYAYFDGRPLETDSV